MARQLPLVPISDEKMERGQHSWRRIFTKRSLFSQNFCGNFCFSQTACLGGVMIDPRNQITAAVPAAFFAAFEEETGEAYAEALRLTRAHFEEPEQRAMLGYHRHALGERAVRLAAGKTGLTAVAECTDPVGGRYTVVRSDGVRLVRAIPQTHRGLPRPAAFRTTLARINAWMDPIQPDLFRPTSSAVLTNQLTAMLIVVPRRYGDLSIPAWVGVGVPRSDLSGWIVRESIDKLLSRYAAVHIPPEPPASPKDNAFPRLRSGIPKRRLSADG